MALLAGLIAAPPATAHHPFRPGCVGGHHHTRSDVTPLAKRAWERRAGPRSVQRRRYRHIRRCAWHPHKVQGRWRAIKKAKRPIREAKRETGGVALPPLPYPGPNGTRWAIPWPIVNCESGGNFTAYNPNYTPGGVGSGPGGAYQAIRSTWLAYGGGQFAPVAHQASPAAQHIVATRIRRAEGLGPWECSYLLGYL